MNAIELKNVKICYKKRLLFDDLNIVVPKGTIVRLVGPNGSGKSSILKVISGLKRPEEGTVAIDEHTLKKGEFATDTGIIINSPKFISNLTGFQNLLALSRINKKITEDDIKVWMARVGLDPDLPQKVKGYSLGMTQKLAICQALMEQPHIVLLDEPLNGLDKNSKEQIVDLIKNVRATTNTTFLIVSHDNYFDEITDIVYEINGERVEKIADNK